jgi:hypothetical protein
MKETQEVYSLTQGEFIVYGWKTEVRSPIESEWSDCPENQKSGGAGFAGAHRFFVWN